MLTDHYHEREHQRHQQQRSGPGMDGFGLCEDYGLGSSLGQPPLCSYQMLPNPACSAMSWIAQSQSEIASEIALAQSGLWTPPHHMMQLQEDASGCLMPPHRSGLPHALPLDNWNYGGMDQHLVTTAVLPSMLQHEQEDGDVELLAEPAAHHFHRAAAASSSKHFFHAQPDATPDQGCYAVPLFLAEIAEQQNHQQQQQQQQQAFFASSADCVREAHSSGSDNLVAESASNLFNTWSTHGVTVADMQSMHTIAAAAAPDFNSLELPDESSSVANDADNLDSSVHSRMAPHLDPIDTLSCASWIVQCKASDSESSGSMQEQVQAAKNPDPGLWRNAHARGPGLHTLDALISNPDELDFQEPHASASKRQRVACYTLESLSKAVNLHLKKEALVKGSPTTTLKSTTRLRASMPATVPAQPLYKDAGVISRDFRILSQRAHTSQDNVATRHHPGPLQSSLLDHRDCVTVADSKTCYRKIPATSVEPQSVAARQRRKKITERVNVLAQLIPGGHKMDTASMFDEAIEYVKFLQLQVNILESLGNIADQAQSPAVSSSSNTGYAFDLPKDMSIHPAAASGYGMKSLSARSPTSSPLVLSEVLQQQLFKQKLCIVSLRQCALSGSSS